MKTLSSRHPLSLSIALVLSLVIPLAALGAPFTWTGTTSTAWDLAANWGGSGFPNAYTDTATIGISTNNAIGITNTDLLGAASGNALTIGNYTPANAAALDIAASGTLGMQGNISLSSGTTNAKRITVEGVLRNDGSVGTHYAISGGSANSIVQLVGGTISAQTNGIWDFQRPVQGYGTISSAFTNIANGTITANVAAQTLHITGPGTLTSSTLSSSVATAVLSLESTLTAAGTGATIAHTGEVDLNGATLIGAASSPFTFNNTTGAIKLTGDSSFQGNITNGAGSGTIIALNGHTLHWNGVTVSNVSGATAFININTGAVLDNTSGNSSISNGAPIVLAGGQLTNTGGGTFNINTPVSGFGTIVGPVFSANSTRATGGTLVLDGTTGAVDVHGTTILTNGVAGDVADLKGNINFGTGGFLYSNPSGGTGNGEVRLDGAILNGVINSNGLGQGAVNVVANSSLVGTYTSSATFGINSGKTFTIAGSTMNANVGSVNNLGTFAIGNGTLNNITANAYTLGGGGSATIAAGLISSTGGGGFVSNNILDGYGNVTAPFTNNGKVIADGSGVDQTLSLSTSAITSIVNADGAGWYATQHGKLLLPPIAVSSPTSYTWGGDPTTQKLVNSIGMAFTGTINPGSLSLALLSLDRPDVPAGLTNLVDVWSVNAGALTFGSVSLTVRYDDVRVAALAVNPSDLRLFGFDGTNWDLIPTNPTDTVNFLVSTSSGMPAFYQDLAIATPEPVTMSILGFGGLMLVLRRRR